MNIDFNASIHNRFDIEVIDAETGKIKQQAQALNVVCNSFFTSMLYNTGPVWYIQYGSGTGTPSISDTSLFVYSGWKAISTTVTVDITNRIITRTGTIQLGISEAVGVTLTEVGFGSNTTSGALTTHALLKDMNGNPISITKTNTDVINITATLFVHYASSYNGAFLRYAYGGNPDNAFFYWLSGGRFTTWGTSYSRWELPLTGFSATRDGHVLTTNSSLASDMRVETTQTVNISEKKLTVTGRYGIDICNLAGGIKYLHVGVRITQTSTSSYGRMNDAIIIPIGAGYDIEGYNVTGESVGTGDGAKTLYTLKFDCYSNVKIYLNGVETTNYTRSNRDITFTTPPAQGDVITADYFSDTVPKDSNHIFDLTVTLQLNQYTPPSDNP